MVIVALDSSPLSPVYDWYSVVVVSTKKVFTAIGLPVTVLYCKLMVSSVEELRS